MPKYAIRYSDGRATNRKGQPLEINAPDADAALEHASFLEAQRMARAKDAGIDVVPVTATITATVKA